MALNFLVTGLKMLKKSLDKKKMKKEAAKKFVGVEKEEKRAKISKIMDRDSSYGGGTKVQKSASASKLMDIDIDKVAKTTPKSAKIDYKLMTAKVDNIVGMTDALAFLTGAQSEQKKNELELLRQQKEAEKKRKKEAKLEKKDELGDKIKRGVKKQAQKPLDAIVKFITNIALGALVMFLIKNADKIRQLFKTIGENLQVFSKLLRVTIFGLQNGMKIASAAFKMLSKGAQKLLSPVGKAFKAIGSKIRGVFKALGGKFLKILKRIPGVKGLTNLIKGAKNLLTGAKSVNAANKIVKTGKTLKKSKALVTAGVKTAKPVVTKAASKVTSKVVSSGAKPVSKEISKKVASSVLKKGITKAPTRLLIKFFGKNTAKMIVGSSGLFATMSKVAKGIKIPIVGPIIVAITSILSGDKLEKTLFKTLGTALGGLIGGGLGVALGGLGAPFGMLLGEIVGEFVGDLLYNVIRGDDDGTKGVEFLKKKFGQILTGAGNASKSVMNFAMSMLGKFGNFFKDGFEKFTEDFPTKDIVKGGGVQATLGKFAGLFGLTEESPYLENGLLTKIPDLSLLTPFGMDKLLPHLKNSFFPSGEKEEIPKNGGTSSSGGEEDKEVTEAKVETADNKDALDDMFADWEKEDGDVAPTRGEDGKPLAQLGEKDTSSTSSTISDVSSKATYDDPSETVILSEPSGSNSASGVVQNTKAVLVASDQKAMLNSYQKTQVKTSLAKI